MSSRSDLPGCTSPASLALSYRRLTRPLNPRRWLCLLVAVAVPAVLMATQATPLLQAKSVDPAAAAFAITSAYGSAAGDSGLGDAALNELAQDTLVGTAAWGAPRVVNHVVNVAVDAAHLRAGAGTEFAVLTSLDSTATVTLLAHDREWYQVRTQSGKDGWMFADLLDLPTEVTVGLVEINAQSGLALASHSTVNQDGVRLRKGPSTDYGVVTRLDLGSSIVVLQAQNDWRKVRMSDGRVGWLLGRYLATGSSSSHSSQPNLVGYTVGDGVRLRRGPGSGYAELMRLEDSSKVVLLARHGAWYKVVTAHGRRGWIAADLLSLDSGVGDLVPLTDNIPALPQAKPVRRVIVPSSGLGGDAARIALAKVGTAYVWGAEGPWSFDCSGLLVYAYRRLGISLPHSAAGLFSSAYGSRIWRKDDLQAGDMLFFRNTAGWGITHAALYVGGGMMVTANSPRTGVQYQSLYTSYWQRHYAGAIRPYRQ